MSQPLEIFAVATPGLENALHSEIVEKGFQNVQLVAGGITFSGGWPEVWRANLVLRGATKILARIGEFRAFHLAQLDKRSRKFEWSAYLRPDVPVRVEVTSKKSKIYHAGAAAQRIETALREELGIEISDKADVQLKVRIFDNLVTISVDTSGEGLHKRGHKAQVNKAPMRETLASLFLREMGYDGTQTLLDPMCGSGTFPIEAAEIAAGFVAGRSRHFAFDQMASFDAQAFTTMRNAETRTPPVRFFGSDRDQGAVKMSKANAERAGVADWITFEHKPISDIEPPEGAPGIVIINPPYGGRIGNKKLLFGLYGAMGDVLRERFSGWRVGIITNEPGLAKATRLPFKPTGPQISHGGIGVKLYQTGPL